MEGKLRGKTEHVADVLRCLLEEQPRHITELGHLTRLRSNQINFITKKALDAGLMIRSPSGMSPFAVTEKGKEFLEKFDKIINLLQES